MMLYSWGTEPDLWSGGVLDDLADYEAWLGEYAIWAAMMTRQDGPPPAAPGRGE